MLNGVGKSPQQITTDDLRKYLMDYQTRRRSSKVTIDNIRRILSSFFSWLEDEDFIMKSPVRRAALPSCSFLATRREMEVWMAPQQRAKAIE